MISPTGVSLDSFRKAEAYLGLSEAGSDGPAAAASEAGRGGPAASAPPAEANIRRSARADARQQKERECVKKLLLTIISQPIPGWAEPTAAAGSAKATASAGDGAEGSGSGSVPPVGVVLGATVPPVSTRHKVKVEDDLFIPGGVVGAPSVMGLAAVSPTSIKVTDDPFFIPGNFASPPKLSDAELRAEAKLEAEREAKRQAQLAAQAVEEMRERAEELLELIARAERLGVESGVLSQVREYMAKLGNAQKAQKSITTAERPVAPLRGPYCQTAYRGVFRKMLTFGGVRLRLYEAFHNATYLGVFGRKEEAAVAYAIHMHATKGLEAPEDDPFASPGAALPPDGDGGAGESANVPSLALKALSSLTAPLFKRSSGFRIGVDLVLPSNRRSLKGPDKGPEKGPDKGPTKRPVGSVTAGREEEAGVQRASLSADEIDARLWVGASAAGWTVYRRSGDGHYRYVSPDGAVYTQRPEEPALSSRASPSKRQKVGATSPAAVVSIPTPPRPLVAPTTAGPPMAAALPPPPQAARAAAPPPAPRSPAASAPPPASTAVLPSRSPSGPSATSPSPRPPAVAAAAASSAAAPPRPQPQPPRPQPQVTGAAANESPRGGTSAPSAPPLFTPPLCERHPTIPGKLRVASSLMVGVSGGEKVAVRLPGCEHVVRITWPSEVKQYLTFTLGTCPQCPR
jgi:hypothetical protein